MDENIKWMKKALDEANKSLKKNEVPVGCIAVMDGKIIGRGHNQREDLGDPTAHAEIQCIKKAAKKIGDWRLNDVVLYVTLEPCPMCSGAIIHARIRNVVFGTPDPKLGMSKWLKKNKVKIVKDILKKDCQKILKDFFRKIRKGGRVA